jgi:polyisoprenoid-binding protein YceI
MIAGMFHRYRWLVFAVAALVAAPVAATFVYLNVIRDDPPPELTLDDVTTTTGRDGPSTPGGSTVQGIEGTWSVGDGSIVGYRVREQLFGQSAEAVGRSEGVTGSLTIVGTSVTQAAFEVDMTTFESDESRRDAQFEGRIMEVAQFPTATFSLTQPIELGSVPADGQDVEVEATGDLTLHGVTREVTIPLAARLDGSTFAVDGSVTITFADHGIDDPSGGPASVGTDGELEVLLVFTR